MRRTVGFYTDKKDRIRPITARRRRVKVILPPRNLVRPLTGTSTQGLTLIPAKTEPGKTMIAEFEEGKQKGFCTVKTSNLPKVVSRKELWDQYPNEIKGSLERTLPKRVLLLRDKGKFVAIGKAKDNLFVGWDLKETSKNLLDPTNPEDVELWAKDPLKYDLIGFDTAEPQRDKLLLYRGINLPFYRPDRTIDDLLKGEEESWSGNIHVARAYALTDRLPYMPTAWHLFREMQVQDIVSKTKFLPFEMMEKMSPDPALQKYLKEMREADNFYLLKSNIPGKHIRAFHPETDPFVCEAKVKVKRGKDQRLSEVYPGLKIGRFDSYDKILWYDVEKLENKYKTTKIKLSALRNEKPDEVSVIPSIKIIFGDEKIQERVANLYSTFGEDRVFDYIKSNPEANNKTFIYIPKEESRVLANA